MPLLMTCPACGRDLSSKAASCQHCGHPGYATISSAGGDKVRGLIAKAEGVAAWQRKFKWYHSFLSGFCEKTAVGSLLVFMYQGKPVEAAGLALLFLVTAMFLAGKASK